MGAVIARRISESVESKSARSLFPMTGAGAVSFASKWAVASTVSFLLISPPTFAQEATGQPNAFVGRNQGDTPLTAMPESEGGAILSPFSQRSDASPAVAVVEKTKTAEVGLLPSTIGATLMVAGLVFLLRKAMD